MMSIESGDEVVETACELCGLRLGFVDCGGMCCCESCAQTYGVRLADWREEMDDDIRNS